MRSLFSALFSRVGTAGFYDSFDKQLSNIDKSIQILKAGKQRRQKVWNAVRARFFAGFIAIYAIILAYAAWVVRQPPGVFTTTQHAKRILPVFIAPLLAAAVYIVSSKLHGYLNRRTDMRIAKYDAKMKKAVDEMRDATHFTRTQELLQKWDPQYAAAQQKMMTERRGGNATATAAQQAGGSGKKLPAFAKGAASVAATAVTGAGARLSAALGQVWVQAADTLIKDDPTMLAVLEQAKQQAEALERENMQLRLALQQSGNRAGGVGRGVPQIDGRDVEFSGAFGSPISGDRGGGAVGGGGVVEEVEADSPQMPADAVDAHVDVNDTTPAEANEVSDTVAATQKAEGSGARRRSGRQTRR